MDEIVAKVKRKFTRWKKLQTQTTATESKRKAAVTKPVPCSFLFRPFFIHLQTYNWHFLPSYTPFSIGKTNEIKPCVLYMWQGYCILHIPSRIELVVTWTLKQLALVLRLKSTTSVRLNCEGWKSNFPAVVRSGSGSLPFNISHTHCEWPDCDWINLNRPEEKGKTRNHVLLRKKSLLGFRYSTQS
jgi:hypothetical protein